MDSCSICLENEPCEIYVLNCDHVFHKKCITDWLMRNPTCPLCRMPVDADARYVHDDIMSEARRRTLKTLKDIIRNTAMMFEIISPNMHGFTNEINEFLMSDLGQQLLEKAASGTDSQTMQPLLGSLLFAACMKYFG